jgi:hypothetical protein
MSGVYGDQLAFFPEQFENAVAFRMDPQLVGGYGKRKDIVYTSGVFQWLKGGSLDIEEHLLVRADTIVFWTYDELEEGMFLEREDGRIFRIVKEMDWEQKGTFYRFVIETVVGNTDQQVPDPEVTLGIDQYH